MIYLTIQEAMEKLNISRQAIYGAIWRGALTAHKKYGKTLLDADEVEAYQPNNYLNKRPHNQGRTKKSIVRQTEEGASE